MKKIFKIINLKEEGEKIKDDKKYSIHPTPKKKEKKNSKTDFSPILIKETHLGFKTNSSYKKPKLYGLDSPNKKLNKIYSPSIKIEGRDLFNTKIEKSHRRKLNFEEKEENEEKKEKLEEKLKSYMNNNNPYLKQNKMDNEFNIIKTLKKYKLDFVYKVEEKKSKQLYCIKKIHKNSEKNNINNLKNLFIDMKTKLTYKNNLKDKDNFCLGFEFCNQCKDFWEEEDNLDLVHRELYSPDIYMYILYEYYPNGDLLNYLQKLEKNKFNFTPDFYWDIIFEMILGLKYFHELGYLHLDIKPTNFLVDQKGYIKLIDFGLCHKISKIPFLTDIFEGDKVYISKELFNFNSKGILDTKSDIFSLGLSILEIIGKINLPLSGKSWTDIRNGNFKIEDNLLKKSNLKENKEIFIKLISKMIAPIEERLEIIQLIDNFEELKNRYELLKKNKYKKSQKNNIIYNCF